MAKKGNGGAGDDVKKQFEFLDEVKKLAKKHGIEMGGLSQQITPGQSQLQIQVREQNNKVIVDFGKQIAWMAMNIDQATKFAASIIKLVQDVQKRNAIAAEGGEGELPAEHKADPEQDQEAEKPAEKDEVDKTK